MSRNRARQMTSTLREPLLPSGSGNARPLKIAIRHNSDETEEEGDSDLDGHQRSRRSGGKPGARKREEDIIDEIHLYPAPPARAGWGPWANRLAFGKYRDKTAIASFAAAVCATVLIGAYLSWGARTPAQPKTPKTRPSSYYTITRSLPILILLTLLSFGAGVGNLLLLRNLNRFGGAKVLRTGLMGVPIVLGLGWAWAFAGSFIYDDEAWSGGGWSTTGLRVISIVPLALAVIFARMVWQRRKALSRSIAVLELSCNVVLQHPALLVLALASLGAFALITVPFLFLFTRLFLVGHFGRQVGDTMEWETDTKAAWLAWATLCAWLWTWAVLRGVQRVTVAGVPLTHVVVLLAGLGAVLQGYSNLALVYVGVTGDGFWTAAKKSAQLVSRRGVQGVMEGLVVNLVLDLTAIALSFLAGLVGFLFSAHQLHVPADAPLVGLLCALLPYWTLRLCADVLSNASDTLYLCYAIDHASNDEHCPKAAEAFTAKSTAVSDSILPF
uniref:Protein PNS1 n=1 Tax=Kalmanozyma brasiliensis (strain GHG001) TaxID=1365824 RepID=V5EG28_KALBG